MPVLMSNVVLLQLGLFDQAGRGEGRTRGEQIEVQSKKQMYCIGFSFNQKDFFYQRCFLGPKYSRRCFFLLLLHLRGLLRIDRTITDIKKVFVTKRLEQNP